eukprot:503407_1
MELSNSRYKGATINHTLPNQWNVIKKRKKINDAMSRERFGYICLGSNLRLKYSNQHINSNYSNNNITTNPINEYSGKNYRNSTLHNMTTRSMRQKYVPSIQQETQNNSGEFDDDNEYISNWIVKDNNIEYGNVYQNDYSQYLQRLEYDIDARNNYESESESEQQNEIEEKTQINDNDVYNPQTDIKYEYNKQEYDDISEPECDILSESSMDSNDYRIAMQLEKDMNVYNEKTDGLYEKITDEDRKRDKAAEKENEMETEMEEQERKSYGHNRFEAPPVSFRKPHRFRPGTVALREIRRYQKSWKMLISKNEFEKCIGSIVYKSYPHNIKWQESAIYALQQGVESYAVDLFEASNLCAIHAKRVNICPHDVQMATRLRHEY